MSLVNQELPVHNGKTMVSLLFMINSKSAEIYKEDDSNSDENWVIKVPLDANVLAFSDRPHRIAKSIPDGISGFVSIFLNSDFTTDPPNVTVAGNLDSDSKEYYSVIEMGIPKLYESHVLLPIIRPIGEETYVPQGSYSNLSLVVDNVWGWILGSIETAAAAVGTGLACTVGEVATLGAATAGCVAAVAGTIALGGSVIKDNI